MYALSVSAEGDCYLCVPPDLGIEAAALGASESALPGTAPAEAVHTFTLDSGASLCFFRDSTTLTPLSAPVPLRLADPSRGQVLARSSTVLQCPAVPSGSMSAGVDLHVYTNWLSPGHVHSSARVEPVHTSYRASSGSCICPVLRIRSLAPPCSCRLLSHQTLLWHHRLGHPSLPRLRGMHFHLLVSGIPRSLPPLPPSPAPPCLPCIEGRQRAAPHSSFPSTTASLQNLHMDVWGPARVSGQGRERYFLLSVSSFASGSTRTFLSCVCTLIEVQNGIAERRIGLVMEVARTSMIHAAAPHFLWPFAARYAAHQLNLWPRVSLPETSPTLHWTGKVGVASVFRVWVSRAFVRDTSADKLSARSIPCVFLCFPPDAPGSHFYHPTSCRIFLSQNVTFDKSVPFYLSEVDHAPSGVSQVDPLPGNVPLEIAVGLGAAPCAASGGAELGGAESEAAGSGAGGAEPGGAESGGAEPRCVELGVGESEGADSRGAEPWGTTSPRLSPRPEPLFPQQLSYWFAQRTCLWSGAAGAGVFAAGDTGAGGAGFPFGAGGTGSAAAAGPGGAHTRGTGAAGTGSVGGAGARGAGVEDPAEPGGARAGGTGAGGAGALGPAPRLRSLATTTAALESCATMASLRVLPFDPEGRPVAFDTWHDDLQLYLLSNSRDSVSLFDHVSGAALAPPATADISTCSQWLSRDATTRLAIRNHLPATECAHFGEHRTAQALYAAVVARYSSLATAAIGRLLLPYLFPELSAFPTVADLVTHLRTSDARYRAAVLADTKHRNSKGKGGRGSGGGSGGDGGGRGSGSGGSGRGGGGGGGGGGSGTGGGGGGSGGGGGGSRGSGGSGGGGTSGGWSGPQRGVPGGGTGQQQQRRSETQTPQQLREWLVQRGAGEGSETCPYRTEFGDDVERPRCAELLRSGVAIFDLDFDVIISAMYALSFSDEGDYYWCVPPDPGIAAAALGASASGAPLGTAPAEALHTFTLDSGASRCFFRDSTTLTPLPAPVPVRLADPSGGLVVASSSTVLPCPAVPSGSLTGLHLPSFSTNLVSTAALQDAMVTTTTRGGQRVSICTCTRTGRHLATFTRRPGSSLYTLASEPPQVAASAQVSASGLVAASCSCRLLTHQILLWHHRLGHPSLPRLRGMHSCLLVSSLPRSLPPLPPSPAPPFLPCVEGRQCAAPHSSSFPPTTAPLQTLHMDVKGEVSAVLIPWIRAVRLQLRKRFGQDLPVLRLHSDRGGELSSDLLRDFCRGEGIRQSSTLPDSPQQNGIAERRIGLVMEVARTSMIHAAAPHFLWPFAARYAAHQLNLWPRVSLPETSPTLRWTGKVGDASVFRVWSSRAFVRDPSADKLSARAIPCVFLGFVPDAPGWQFYHPTSRRVLPSQDVTFDESVFFYRSAPSPPPPLFLAPGPPPVDPLPPKGPAPSGVSQEVPLPGTAPVQVAVVSGAASGGAEAGDAGSEGAGCGGAEPEGVEAGGAESEGADSRGAEPRGAALSGGRAGASPRLSSQQQCAIVTTGAGDPTEPGAAGAAGGGAGVARVGGAGGPVRPRPYFVPLLQQVHGVPSSTGLPPPFQCPPPDQSQPPLQPASPLPVPSPYTEQFGGLTECHEPASCSVLPVCTARRAPRSCPPPVPKRVPLPTPPESSLPEVPDPESDRARAAIPTVARLLATAVTNPSFESAAASALVAELLDFAAACRLDYASALVTESVPASPPSVGGECALSTDVLEDRQEDFECLAAAVPRFASLMLAPKEDPDAPDILTPRSYAKAITGPYSSQWQAAMDAEMASWKSTGTYVDEVPPPGVNIVDAMWIFRVKRSPGSPPAFKARYDARGFSQQQGVDYFQTFSPTTKMTNLWVLLHVAAQHDYELHSMDFSTALLQGSLHEEIWLHRPPGFTGSFPAGTQWSLHRLVYGLRQAPREWHDTLRTTLAALGFTPSTADPSLILRTDTSLPPFYVLVYVDDLVFATADTEALTLVKSELQKRHTCTDLGELRSYLGLQITRDKARRTITLTQSHMVHKVLQPFGFQYSSPQLTPLSTSHSL
ncbi:unnamed protein product [Closterium sp. NIES-54]